MGDKAGKSQRYSNWNQARNWFLFRGDLRLTKTLAALVKSPRVAARKVARR